jgi:hypothetical protein
VNREASVNGESEECQGKGNPPANWAAVNVDIWLSSKIFWLYS